MATADTLPERAVQPAQSSPDEVEEFLRRLIPADTAVRRRMFSGLLRDMTTGGSQ